MFQHSLKMFLSVKISFLFRCQAVLKGRSPYLVGYLIVMFVTMLVLLLNVTVITDGRVRKFVVMSSSMSLVISFLKELISVTAVSKIVSLSLRYHHS